MWIGPVKIPIICEAVLLVATMVVYAGAVGVNSEVSFSGLTFLLLGLYALALFVDGKLSTLKPPISYLPAMLRLILFAILVGSFAGLYGGWGAASLNAPTVSFFYLLFLLQAFYRDAGRILWVGGAGLLCKIVLVGVASGQGTIALSYTYYLRSPSINLVVEAEKLVAMGLFVGMLYLFVRQNKLVP